MFIIPYLRQLANLFLSIILHHPTISTPDHFPEQQGPVRDPLRRLDRKRYYRWGHDSTLYGSGQWRFYGLGYGEKVCDSCRCHGKILLLIPVFELLCCLAWMGHYFYHDIYVEVFHM